MANEFVARRGIIVPSNGAQITGSLLVSGSINATGYAVIAKEFTGSFSGSIGTATTASYVAWGNVDNKPANLVSSSAQVTAFLPGGTVSSSAQYPGWVTASSQIDITATTGYTTFSSSLATVDANQQSQINALVASTSSYALQSQLAGVASSSAQVKAYLPGGTISSSAQFNSLNSPFTGSFTGSFTGDGSGLTGIASTLLFSGSTTGNDTLNLKTEALIFSGSNGLSATVTNNTVTFGLPLGTVSASSQIDYNSIQNKLSGVVSSSAQVAPLLPNGTVSSSAQYPGWVTSSTQIVWSSVNYNTGIVSSSAQTVANIAGQQIAPSAVSASGGLSGSFIQVSGNGIIGGNLNVTGTITATSQSIQYVSSSQLNVATNRIIVNTDNSLRFGGISVVDSGSAGKSGSLYWDSLGDRWIYEDVSGGVYTSAILVAGPKNTGATGNERGLLDGRVPVASGDDHIDTAAASSSIRVDFPTRLTHVEAGLFVTGNLTANGTVTLQGIPSSSAQITALLPTNTVSSSTQVQTFLPVGTVSSSAQYPGWVTSSTQIVYTSLQSIPSGIVSSSAQVAPLLPNGTVSSSAQYPGWVTASSQIQLASITGTTFAAANFTFPQQLTVSGVLSGSTSAYITNTLYSGSTVTGIVGPVTNQVVASVLTGSLNSAHFDYVINDGTNYRTGTVMSVWTPASTVEFTETSTADIGNTSQASFTVDVVSGIARLKFTNISGTWAVKTAVRAL